MPEFEYSTLANPEDVQQLGKVLEQCFISSPGHSEIYFKRLSLENFRVIRHSEQVVGGLAKILIGQ